MGFYQSLGGTVQDAQGNAIFTITGGLWRTRLAARTVLWEVENNTDIQTKISYKSGGLESAIVKFQPAVHVWLVAEGNSPGISGRLDTLAYDFAGRVVDWKFTPDNLHGPIGAGGAPGLQRHLEFARDPRDFMNALPFASSGHSQYCTGTNANTCTVVRPMVTRLRIVSDGDFPGLRVALKDGATLWLSKQGNGQFSNFITVHAPTGLLLNNVDFDVQARTVHGVVEQLVANVNAGQLTTASALLVLTAGSSLSFANIRFSNEDSPAVIDAQDGSSTGSLGTGTLIALSAGHDNASQLAIRSAQVNLVGARVEINEGCSRGCRSRTDRLWPPW